MSYNMQWKYEEVMAANPHFKQEDIDELRRWVQSEEAPSNVPKDLSESMLLCFHNACNWIISDTKKCVKAYFTVRDRAPELFDDRDYDIDSFKHAADGVYFSLLPTRTDDDQLILYHGINFPEAEKYFFSTSTKLFYMTVDRCIMEYGPVKGLVLLFDMSHVNIAHLTRCNLMTLSKCFTYIQEAMPVKISRINIMNTVPFFNKVLALIKPFMNKELHSLIHLYKSDVDLEEFYRTVLPKRCLPTMYGGDLGDTQSLDKVNTERLKALKPSFEDEQRQRHACLKKSKKSQKIETGFQDLSID